MSQRGLERQFLDGFGVGCDAMGPLKAQAAGTRNVRRFARDSSTPAGHTNVAMPIVRACRCAVLCFEMAASKFIVKHCENEKSITNTSKKHSKIDILEWHFLFFHTPLI